jgi:hypothetical protein
MKQKTRVSQRLARVSCTSLDGVKQYNGGRVSFTLSSENGSGN